MTFALVGTPTNPGLQGTSQGASSTFSLTTTPTAGNTVVIPLLVFAAGLCQTVTVGGQSASRVSTASYDGANFIATELWYILNYSGSGNSVVITYFNAAGQAGLGNFPLCSVAEFSSAGSVTLDQVPTSTTGTSTAPAITSGTTTGASEVVVAIVSNLTGNTTITDASGYATPALFNDGNWNADTSGACSYKIVSATGAQTATWGFSPSQSWRCLMATFKDAAAVTSAPTLPTNRRAPGFPRRAPLPGIARIGAGLLVATTPTQQSITGTGSAACQPFGASATGTVTFTGTGSAAASPFACSAAGAFAIPAPAAQPQPQARLLYPIWRVAPPLLRLGSGFLAVSVATAPSFSGSGSAALSPFASSAAGLETFTGSGSTALQPFAVTASGLVTLTGSGTAALSPFAASATGNEAFVGSASSALSPFAASASGLETFTGSAAAALAPFAASGSGLEAFAASASAAMSPFGASAAGLEAFDGSGSAALSPFDSLGFGSPPAVSWAARPQPQALGYPLKIRLRPIPQLNSRLLVPSLVGAGGSGSAALSPFGASATGFVTFIGSASGALSPFAAAATGLETFTGSGSAAESPFAASVAGAETFAGSASAACSPFDASATGTSGNAFNGSASCAMSPFAMSASGLETFTGTTSAALSPFACSVAGLETFTGSGSAACQPFAATGNGAQGAVFSGSASAAASPFTTSSTGAETFSGAASCATSPFAVTAAGVEAFTGTCSSATSPFGSSATGLHILPITGTASCAAAPFGASVVGVVLNPVSGTCTASISPFNCNALSGVPFAAALARVRTARVTHLTSLSRRARITRLL